MKLSVLALVVFFAATGVAASSEAFSSAPNDDVLAVESGQAEWANGSHGLDRPRVVRMRSSRRIAVRRYRIVDQRVPRRVGLFPRCPPADRTIFDECRFPIAPRPLVVRRLW